MRELKETTRDSPIHAPGRPRIEPDAEVAQLEAELNADVQLLTDGSGRCGGILTTLDTMWPKIKEGLDAGQLVALGLIRARSFSPGDLGKNHQVLAYGYDLDDAKQVTLMMCDPNHPDDDHVTLSFSVAHPPAYEGLDYCVDGTPVAWDSEQFTYGAFVTSYRHVSTGAAVRHGELSRKPHLLGGEGVFSWSAG